MAGDIRELKPNCQFLAHLPSVMAEGNSDDIDRLNDYMQRTKLDIANIYARYSDKNVQELIDFMRLDTPISAQEAKEMGFATVVQEFKAVAKYQTDNNMPETKTSKLDDITDRLTKQLDKVIDLVTPKNQEEVLEVKDVTVELNDGSFLFVVSEDGELVGKVAYVADAEGNRTEELAPEGTHQLQDGREITIGEGGIVDSVSEAEAKEEEDDLEAKLAAALAENEELKNSNEELKNNLEEKEVQVQSVETEVKNLKATVVGSLKAVPKANTKPSDGEEPVKEVHPLDKFAESLRQNRL